MRKYAQGTKITVTQTVADAQSVIARYGADRFQHLVDGANNRAIFQFETSGYSISFGFPLGTTQERLRLYRAAYLCVKAKLESVASGIESPAQAFAAHIVDDNGELMIKKITPMLPAVKRRVG